VDKVLHCPRSRRPSAEVLWEIICRLILALFLRGVTTLVEMRLP
jgi:hypothetical protein